MVHVTNEFCSPDQDLTGRVALITGVNSAAVESWVLVDWLGGRWQAKNISRWWQLKYFLCSPRKLGKIPNLTNIFPRGWNHRLDFIQGSYNISISMIIRCPIHVFGNVLFSADLGRFSKLPNKITELHCFPSETNPRFWKVFSGPHFAAGARTQKIWEAIKWKDFWGNIPWWSMMIFGQSTIRIQICPKSPGFPL